MTRRPLARRSSVNATSGTVVGTHDLGVGRRMAATDRLGRSYRLVRGAVGRTFVDSEGHAASVSPSLVAVAPRGGPSRARGPGPGARPRRAGDADAGRQVDRHRTRRRGLGRLQPGDEARRQQPGGQGRERHPGRQGRRRPRGRHPDGRDARHAARRRDLPRRIHVAGDRRRRRARDLDLHGGHRRERGPDRDPDCRTASAEASATASPTTAPTPSASPRPPRPARRATARPPGAAAT